ncbi:hypothetical protein SELMODRAFT_231973 [Selaginella moellendorffii]|uniref:Growth arrest-specific protein 8 domain-containing protein n=1 Tax=Selaginella moellendorffii TaxID=88036 RepID=D8RNJ7_SELML|nr:hypothetical protein SELMODRAFT_231973 [Selaginella moellendorffii]
MAPKKKDAGKGKGKDAAAAAVDAGPSIQELQAQIDGITAERDKEAKQRNRSQIERDKLNCFMEIKKKEREHAEAELRIKDRQMEEIAEKHQTDLKAIHFFFSLQVFSQKMKHLLYEQQVLVSTVKGDNELALKLQREEAATRESQLLDEQRDLKDKIREVELSYEEQLKQMKQDHAKEITKMRREFDINAKDLLLKTEKKMRQVQAENDLRRKQEIHEIEERKNLHISELIKKHEKAFSEIKCYYNDITQNNLDLIKTLKEDINDMKRKEQANEKLMYEISQENKRLTEPLTRSLKEVESLRKQLDSHEKDRQSLLQLRGQHSDVLKHTSQLEWEYRIVLDKLEKVQADRDDLYARFEACVFDVQQKCGVKSTLLQRQVQVLGEQLEKKEAQLGEALGNGKMDPATVHLVKYGIDKMLEAKNQQIKTLYYELGRVTKAYTTIMRNFEAKLAEYGIPLPEMGLPHYISKIRL